MGWSTSVRSVDADGNEHRLEYWIGQRTLQGWRVPEPWPTAGNWVGSLPEAEIISSTLRSGYPNQYEVTIPGLLTALADEFPESYRELIRGKMFEPDVDALEERVRDLPEGTVIRVEVWDQS